jgi:hypothetical protein
MRYGEKIKVMDHVVPKKIPLRAASLVSHRLTIEEMRDGPGSRGFRSYSKPTFNEEYIPHQLNKMDINENLGLKRVLTSK